jgi:hypothetical protein
MVVDVIAPVILAVHLNGNDTVSVIAATVDGDQPRYSSQATGTGTV